MLTKSFSIYAGEKEQNMTNPETIMTELKFLIETYEKAKNKDEFLKRLKILFLEEQVGKEAYDCMQIILGKQTLVLDIQKNLLYSKT